MQYHPKIDYKILDIYHRLKSLRIDSDILQIHPKIDFRIHLKCIIRLFITFPDYFLCLITCSQDIANRFKLDILGMINLKDIIYLLYIIDQKCPNSPNYPISLKDISPLRLDRCGKWQAN